MQTDNGPYEENGSTEKGVLWALKTYQRVIREWAPHLTANEFMVVMQVLDRTIGWQKVEATFRSNRLLGGDAKYGGMQSAMHRSTMMKVLSDLERRGIIARAPDKSRPWLRAFSVNLQWNPMYDPARIKAPPKRRRPVSAGDPPVSK